MKLRQLLFLAFFLIPAGASAVKHGGGVAYDRHGNKYVVADGGKLILESDWNKQLEAAGELLRVNVELTGMGKLRYIITPYSLKMKEMPRNSKVFCGLSMISGGRGEFNDRDTRNSILILTTGKKMNLWEFAKSRQKFAKYRRDWDTSAAGFAWHIQALKEVSADDRVELIKLWTGDAKIDGNQLQQMCTLLQGPPDKFKAATILLPRMTRVSNDGGELLFYIQGSTDRNPDAMEFLSANGLLSFAERVDFLDVVWASEFANVLREFKAGELLALQFERRMGWWQQLQIKDSDSDKAMGIEVLFSPNEVTLDMVLQITDQEVRMRTIKYLATNKISFSKKELEQYIQLIPLVNTNGVDTLCSLAPFIAFEFSVPELADFVSEVPDNYKAQMMKALGFETMRSLGWENSLRIFENTVSQYLAEMVDAGLFSGIELTTERKSQILEIPHTVHVGQVRDALRNL